MYLVVVVGGVDLLERLIFGLVKRKNRDCSP